MPLQRDKAKQFHARRNFRPHPRVTPKAIVRERIETVRRKGIYLLPNLFTLSSLFLRLLCRHHCDGRRL